MQSRPLSAFDELLVLLDDGLRTVCATASSRRANPADSLATEEIGEDERELAGRLMRVNHCGEVCAQALYRGGALVARSPQVRAKLQQAASEENDHLAWTESRLRDLDTDRSLLNPCWYAGSFAIGALAGLAGDRWNLGFVAETEGQVVAHLDRHLQRLPVKDHKSRAILGQMREDEGRHATVAIEAGAATLAPPLRTLMRFASRVMTQTSYWI
jgi:ubiquinone biosynthesis monooxygenase Coq7